MNARRIHTIVIGAGQAGLALSRSLTDHRIEHVLLERGRIRDGVSDGTRFVSSRRIG